jgi:hypothetical protein
VYVRGDPVNTFDLDGRGNPPRSCASAKFRGNAGTIFIQHKPGQTRIQWGIYFYGKNANPLQYGPWKVDVYVNGKRYDHKDQYYAPHGSISAAVAQPGSTISIVATYKLNLGFFSIRGRSVHNKCVVPGMPGNN